MRAMVFEGTEHFRFDIVEECVSLYEAAVVEKQRITEHDLTGQALYNRQRHPDEEHASPRWNGRLQHRPDRKLGWIGRWKNDAGKWRSKRVPSMIHTKQKAIRWFADWIASMPPLK